MPENVNIEIVCKENCNNAPKKEQIKNFNIAYAQADVEALIQFVSDNVEWTIVGEHTIKGKEQFAAAIEQMQHHQATKLEILNIITHGNTAAANGVITFGDQSYGICDVYRFNGFGKNAKISTITSYAVQL